MHDRPSQRHVSNLYAALGFFEGCGLMLLVITMVILLGTPELPNGKSLLAELPNGYALLALVIGSLVAQGVAMALRLKLRAP